jgi:hypothetical protein
MNDLEGTIRGMTVECQSEKGIIHSYRIGLSKLKIRVSAELRYTGIS